MALGLEHSLYLLVCHAASSGCQDVEVTLHLQECVEARQQCEPLSRVLLGYAFSRQWLRSETVVPRPFEVYLEVLR